MRFIVPLIPVSITIQRRRLGPFRLRTALVGVAIVALALGGLRVARRLGHWRRMAAHHAAEEDWWRQAIGQARRDFASGRTGNYVPFSIRMTAYHAAMGDKYQAAAAQPWPMVESDPPIPTMVR